MRSHLAHRILNLVGDVRNDLHRLAEIIPAPLLENDLLVDAASGQVVLPRQVSVGKTLVVAQVEVGLSPVVGNEDLAMLKRRHGSWIDAFRYGSNFMRLTLCPLISCWLPMEAAASP